MAPPGVGFRRVAGAAARPGKPFFLEEDGPWSQEQFTLFVQDLEVKESSGVRPGFMAEGLHAKQVGRTAGGPG
jgi:hypothetical protein